MSQTSVLIPTLSLHFGADKHAIVVSAAGIEAFLPISVLDGKPIETLPVSGTHTSIHEDFHILHGQDGTIAGVGQFPVPNPQALETVTGQAYNSLFSALGEHQAYRIWNYVPDINLLSENMENYWRFNAGRRRAYESRFGEQGCEAHMPAASAVGSTGDTLTIAFIAGTAPARFFENPSQLPAYHYPPQYGPRPPSFARGAWIEACQTGFISGTASIRGHETIGVDDLHTQLKVTIENIEAVRQIMAGAGCRSDRLQLKAYLRHADDHATVKNSLLSAYPQAASLLLLEADICRAPLNVEVEAIIRSEKQANHMPA